MRPAAAPETAQRPSTMRIKTIFLAILTVAVALLAPIQASADVIILEEIIAKVNGDVVLRSDYDASLRELRAEAKRNTQLSDEQRAQQLGEREDDSLRDLIDHRLLVQRAKDMGVSVEAQVLRQRDEIMRQYKIETVDEFETWVMEETGQPAEDLMDRMRNNFLSQAVMGQEVGSRIVIPRPEIEAYYEEHKEEFVRSEGVHLLQIFFSTEGKTEEELEAAKKKAGDIYKRVQKGEPFREMAKRHSEDERTAAAGGDIGIWKRGQLRKEIEDVVFGANKGFISDLIETGNGLLILRVEDNFREGQATLEESQDEIRNRLMGPRYQPAVREYLTKLRGDAYIEIRPGYLDTAAVPGKDTSWSDPAKLVPVTTTREEVLRKKKKRRLLWVIPLPGGGDKNKDKKKEKQADD